MKVSTIGRYLIGDRQAIVSLAADPHSLSVGAILVISAGLARSYDKVDLLAKPWHLAAPFLASTAMAAVLMLTTLGGPKKESPDDDENTSSSGGKFLSLLGLFWLTAPLAWLYGVPYQRCLSEYAATSALFWTLGFVAVWRVALMTRVLSVLTGRHPAYCFGLIMFPADVAVAIAIGFAKLPLITFMGGIFKGSDTEEMIVSTAMMVDNFSTYSSIVWFIWAGIAIFKPRRDWKTRDNSVFPATTRSVWILASSSALVWAIAACFTQPVQRRATAVESLLVHHQIDQGLALMSSHTPSDFPPNWQPPPNIDYFDDDPPVLDVLESVERTHAADWVRKYYLHQFEQGASQGWVSYGVSDTAERSRAEHILRAFPEGPELIKKHFDAVEANRMYFSTMPTTNP